MARPKIGIFDFACCEGCQLQIVNLEEEILDLLGLVNPIEWREAMSNRADPHQRFDVALVEGSITREEDAEKLKAIRARSDLLIALGACATLGGVNKLKNNFGLDDVKQTVYAEAAGMPHLRTDRVRAVHEVVTVDFKVHGCPIEPDELVDAIKSLLAGKTPKVPEHPVCVECKLRENPCRYEFDEVCLGPLTRAGCRARCPSEGFWCFGCRGLLDDANTDAAKEVMAEYGKTVDDLRGKMLLFNSE
jgi:coenzyme F420-reducing hydrogenase gamma subunit